MKIFPAGAVSRNKFVDGYALRGMSVASRAVNDEAVTPA
jgi:hypothetical protein